MTYTSPSKPLTHPPQVLDETLALINGPLLATALREDRSREPISSPICVLGEAKVRTVSNSIALYSFQPRPGGDQLFGSTAAASLWLNVDLHYCSSYRRLTPDFTPLKDGTSTLRHEQTVLAWLIHSGFHFAPPSVNKGTVIPTAIARRPLPVREQT